MLLKSSTIFLVGLFIVLVSSVAFADRVLSPKQQIESGVLPQDVICKEGYVLLEKIGGERVACVKPQSVEKLTARGWAKLNKESIPTIMPDEFESKTSQIQAIYGIADENHSWNIISSSIDGSDKELITTFDFSGLEGQRPTHALGLQLSPDGKYFIYSFPKDNDNSLWLFDTETKEKKLIIKEGENQHLSEYYWSPNSKKITYSLWDIPPDCPECGMPLYSILGPWYLYDVEKGTHEVIREKERSLELLGWWDNDHLIFIKFEIPYEKFPIHLFNINSKITLPLAEIDTLGGIPSLPTVLINQDDGIMVYPAMFEDFNTCNIFIINKKTGHESIILQNNTFCASNYNPNFSISSDGLKMIYGKGMSPSGGPITTTDADDNGVYVISSVYSRDMQAGKETPIFLGKPNGPYFIFGGWNDQYDALAYIVWEKNNGTESFALKISKSDGTLPIEIARTNRATSEHYKEIPFYGWRTID